MVFFDVIIWELFGKLENLSIFNSRLISFYVFIFWQGVYVKYENLWR